MEVSIKGLNKADVLAALYNASRPQGMGFLHYDPTPMTREQAEDILKEQTDFDYLKGRVMKIDLSTDMVRTDLYDRDNGVGSAEKIIELIRAQGDVNGPEIQATHTVGKLGAAEYAEKLAETKSSLDGGVLTLGADELGDPLRSAVKKAVGGK